VRLKTESYQGIIIDDTAANAIRLYCGDPSNPNTTYITSSEGTAGGWGSIYTCRSDGQSNIDGYITGFQLRVEGEGATDDTATNNLRVFCSFPSNGTLEQTLQADGGSYGSWTTARKCQQSNQRVCAIRTQVEPYQGVTGKSAIRILFILTVIDACKMVFSLQGMILL